MNGWRCDGDAVGMGMLGKTFLDLVCIAWRGVGVLGDTMGRMICM